MKKLIFALFVIFAFKTYAQNPLTFVDPRDEKGYYIAKINNLYWFADNLNIPTKTSECFNNVAENCNKYGQLYSLKEAKNVCPTGWRLPNVKDWKSLKAEFGNKADLIAQPNVWKSSKFKNADNKSGLTVFPSGYKLNNFKALFEEAWFWLDDDNYFWKVSNGKNELEKMGNNKNAKMPVRCVFSGE